MGISVGKLSHLETGERQQQPADIAKVLAAYNTPQHEIDRLTLLAEIPDESTWWGAWRDVVPDWVSTFMGLERLSTKEFVFEPMVIPGLMQTEDYARELSRGGRRVRPDHAERVVELRMERAQRLTAEKPLHLHAVVNEQALRLRVGPPEIMKTQYEHLLDLAKRPNITLQVVVPERGPHDAITDQFVVFDFDQARPVVYAELQDGALYVHHPGEVEYLSGDVTKPGGSRSFTQRLRSLRRRPDQGARVNTFAWRKSSFSTDYGSCVEVAFSNAVGIRDSKKPESGHLTVPPEQWSAFLARVKS